MAAPVRVELAFRRLFELKSSLPSKEDTPIQTRAEAVVRVTD
jgi:hypothetical protein